MLLYFFDRVFLDNTYRQYAWLFGILLFVIIFKRYISKLISLLLFRLAGKTYAGKMTEEFLSLILKPLQYLIILNTIYFGFSSLAFPEIWKVEFGGIQLQNFIIGIYTFFLILCVAFLFSRLAEFITRVLKSKAALTEDPWDDQLVAFFRDVLKVFIWFIAIFSILSIVFHVNLASLLAGAGIAGIALAFAAQESLQNIFGSIAIFSEKPFVVGDLVEVDGVTGKVVKVGFRSTRIRSVDTSYMTIPNKNIVNNKLSNLKRRTSRRIQFNLGLNYDTTKEQLEKIISEIKKYANEHPKKNDEVNVGLYNFGTYAIEIMVEIHLEYEAWDKYIETRNEVLFSILGIVKNNKAVIAYPTQILKIENEKFLFGGEKIQ
ncbi:MAG: mechanosensitive ion channel [Fimbriimonadaceae bacterium]|nr:mechanosensitive ion channel [Chitinophagales bacterium]